MGHTGSKRSAGSEPAKKRLTKAMLLPLSPAQIRERSLENHLAFAACRNRSGNNYLFGRLIEVIYLAYYIQDAGYGTAALELFKEAEAALDRDAKRAMRDGVWMVDAADLQLFEDLLALHDRQLASVPSHVIYAVQARLARFIAGKKSTPWTL